MQNFGVYDLRIVNPGRFVLEGGEAEADASDAADAGDGGNGDAPFKADGAAAASTRGRGSGRTDSAPTFLPRSNPRALTATTKTRLCAVGLCTLNSADPPTPRLIGWNMCRPMRRLNDV
jgi:hypothetical protein